MGLEIKMLTSAQILRMVDTNGQIEYKGDASEVKL
jgi:hypothetical protein